MSFTPVEHEWVGSHRIYMPPPVPYIGRPEPEDESGTLVLAPGHVVEVKSAWTRDHLPEAPILLYVVSETTGLGTHVLESDVSGLA